MSLSPEELRAELNAETGKIEWKELERHYARGIVIWVAPELDLIEVAVQFASDNKPAVEQWLTAGQVQRAQEDQARDWTERQPLFWAVVTAPWVLVQEVQSEPEAVH